MSKWPKQIPALTTRQAAISDDFMRKWHEHLPSKFKAIEDFNHGFVSRNSGEFLSTLEIGAGSGGHLDWVGLSGSRKRWYVAVEMREQMADKLKSKHPEVDVIVGDCQTQLKMHGFPLYGSMFDRIVAIHVLEHLPNLPACIREMRRLISPTGKFLVVIPCEGGFVYSMARNVSSRRMFRRLYNEPYDWFIKREHINTPSEIVEEVEKCFKITKREFFPFKVPSVNLNLCVGLSLSPI